MKIKRIFIFLAPLLFAAANVAAQNNVDLSKLSPDQVEAYKQYVATGNATAADAAAVKERTVSQTMTGPASQVAGGTSSVNGVFGSYLFGKQNLTFEPNLNIPTPPYYVLGTYDEIIVDISGLYEANYRLKVNTEGFIRIPNIGPIKVGGITISEASKIIRNRLSAVYTGIGGGTRVNVSLGSIRSIRVTVIGEAYKPGTYTLPSLATAFNALYACGGPGENGSMRDIKVIRRGKVIAEIDVYDYLMKGSLKNNVQLCDEDIIKVEPYRTRVKISGAVKRQGIFETLSGETMSDLINYAGGFTDIANTSAITVIRLKGKEKTVAEVTGEIMNSFKLESGDEVSVSGIYDKYNNRVTLAGAVYRPGVYSTDSCSTVRELIKKADGLRDDAYLGIAYITRQRANDVPEIIGFNIGGIVCGKDSDISLKKDDYVKVEYLSDFTENKSVGVWGAVLTPGSYKLIDKMTVKDLISMAHGFTEQASTDSIELVRIIKDPIKLLTSPEKSMVFKIAMDKNLDIKNNGNDMTLESGDQVIVRNISGYEPIRVARIEGEIVTPGNYNITEKTERISSLVRRAGGFTEYAYPDGAYLIRKESATGIERKLNDIATENIKKELISQTTAKLNATALGAQGMSVKSYSKADSVRQELSGSEVIKSLSDNESLVGIDLGKIIANPGSDNDLYLEDGDEIYVPQKLQTIRVMGSVLFPTYVRYRGGMTLKGYVNRAGGFSDRANKNHAFVLYANGTVKSVKRVFWIRNYPSVTPGSKIIVPGKPIEIKEKMTTAETVSMISALITAAALIVSILK